MEKKKRKDPRQRLGSSQKSVVTISLRVSKDEYDKIVSVCKNREMTLSEYVRKSIVPSAADVLIASL